MKRLIKIIILVLTVCTCDIEKLELKNIGLENIKSMSGIALGYASYDIQDFIDDISLENEELKFDSNSNYYFLISDSINYESENDFIRINDFDGTGNYINQEITGGAVSEFTTIDIPESEYLHEYTAEENVIIDSLYHENGFLYVAVSSNAYVENVKFNLIFTNTENTNDRTPLVVSGNINRPSPNGATNKVISLTSLSDKITHFINNSNQYNITLSASYELNRGDELRGDEELSFEYNFGDMTFTEIHGKFGRKSIKFYEKSIALDFIGDFPGNFRYEDPIIRFNLTNTYGIPLSLDFSNISLNYPEEESLQFISGEILDENTLPEISKASIENPSISNVIEINSSNSNIQELFNNSPSQINFDGIGYSNYYDEIQPNYIKEGNKLTGTMDVVLPFKYQLVNHKDTFRYDLPYNLNFENLDSIFLRVVTINELPLEGQLIIDFLDENDEIIYTVPETTLVLPAEVKEDGVLLTATRVSKDFHLSDEGVRALENGLFLNLRVILNTSKSNTSEPLFFRVNSDYAINFKLGIAARVNQSF